MIETEDVLLSQERLAVLKELINPIKDLAKNWNVDISSELGRYMAEFQGVTDNFAEAAMVIQGSAGVWGRKVEFLYSQVVESRGLLDEEKQRKEKKKKDRQDREEGEKEEEDEMMILESVVIKKPNTNKIDIATVCKYSNFKARIPLCLAPLAIKDTSVENMLYDKKGEVLASRDDFTVNSCIICTSSFAALDIESFRLLKCTIKNTTPFFRRTLNNLTQDQRDPSQLDNITEEQKDQEISFELLSTNNDDDDDVGEGGPLDCSFNSETSEKAAYPICRTPDKNNLVSRPAAIEIKNTLMQKAYIIKFNQKLDRHAETKNKPFKKAIIARPNQNRKRKRNEDTLKPVLLSEVLKKSKKPTRTSVGFNNILKKPICPENISKFHEIFTKETKQAKNCQRRLLTKLPSSLPLPVEILQPPQLIEPDDEESDHEDFGGIVECNDDTIAPTTMLENLETTKQIELLTNDNVQLSYEDLVKQHVDKFTSSAKEHFKISELRERVLAWEKIINPILEKEEKVAPYDVSKYSNMIIQKLSVCEGKEAHFTTLVEGETKEEICRLFLTSLMLTNSGNIELTPLESNANCKLLNTQLFTDILEGYVAPSVEEPRSVKSRKRKGLA